MTMLNLLSCRFKNHTRGSGQPPASLDGTFTQASPSSTSSPATEQVQVSRARHLFGDRNVYLYGVADLYRCAEV
jgi:hypothetical protein